MNENDASAPGLVCYHCGERLSAELADCPACGETLDWSVEVARPRLESNSFSASKWIVALVVAILTIVWIGYAAQKSHDADRRIVEEIEKLAGESGIQVKVEYSGGRVTTLSLSSTAEVDDVDTCLERAMPLANLRQLVLSFSNVTDVGLAHVKGHANLHKLDLQHTQVTDEGLAKLVELQHLEQLYLHKSQASEQGVEQLRRALPNCRIQF